MSKLETEKATLWTIAVAVRTAWLSGLVILLAGAVASPVSAAEGGAGHYVHYGGDVSIDIPIADLESATFSARPDARVMRFKYTKLLTNLGNAFQAACAPGRAAIDAGKA